MLIYHIRLYVDMSEHVRTNNTFRRNLNVITTKFLLTECHCKFNQQKL